MTSCGRTSSTTWDGRPRGHGRPISGSAILKPLLDNAVDWGKGLADYGNASDEFSNFIAAGSTTVAGATLSSGTYTMTRDIWAGSGTIIQSTVTIKTNGYRFFCQGTLTNNGTIDCSGNAAAANTAGAILGFTGSIGQPIGSAGGAGTSGAGATGVAVTNVVGWRGGQWGSNVSIPNAGGAGGTVGAPAATVQLPYNQPLASMARLQSTTAFIALSAGPGGGSGGGDGTNLSGGGGGGGGIVVVVAQILLGTGVIQANGGAGGAAAAAGTPSGGGGGGGGVVIVISQSVQSPAVTATGAKVNNQTIQALGGAPGPAGAGGGVAGSTGSSGLTILLPV